VRRPGPRPLAAALATVTRELEPKTPLARVQRAWRETAGATVNEEAEPVSERAGTVTVACRSAVWAQELSLLAPDLAERLNEALGAPAESPVVRELKFVVRSPGGRR
jgi:predicted nucleic acid-binding Zn ribbon protein